MTLYEEIQRFRREFSMNGISKELVLLPPTASRLE
jgi:hypothetical protein